MHNLNKIIKRGIVYGKEKSKEKGCEKEKEIILNYLFFIFIVAKV